MIFNGAENKKRTGMILINLQKTFITFCDKTLSDKMKCIIFSDKTIKWFHSYLTNKAFFVLLESLFSEAGTRNWGVPQGSILFFLYINALSYKWQEAALKSVFTFYQI